MTAQPLIPTSSLVGTPCGPLPTAGPVASVTVASIPVAPIPSRSAPVGLSPALSATPAVLEAAQAPDRSFLTRIWHAYRAWRNTARMRNMAQDMEPHLLSDVGAPPWLINEASVRRELSRLRHIDYIRW